MPRLEDIRQFLSTLASLGNEPEVLAARGENYEAAPLPDQELSEDIKSLFNDPGLDQGAPDDSLFGEDETPDGAPGEPPDDGLGPEAEFSGMSSLFGDGEPGETPGEEEEPEKPEDFDLGDLDFTDQAPSDSTSPPEDEAEEDGAPPRELFDFPDFPDDSALEEPRDIGPSDFDLPADGRDWGEDHPEGIPEESDEGPPPEESPGESREPSDAGFGFDFPAHHEDALEFSDEDGWSAGEPAAESGAAPLRPDAGAGEPSPGDEGHEEFSLGDFGKEFGISDEDMAVGEEDWGPAINIPEGAPAYIESARGESGVFSLTEDEFVRLKANLSLLPLNVKIAVQEIVAEDKGEEAARIQLIRALVQGKTPRAVAALAGSILGKTLQIPRSYEKRTGLDYEAEKESFAYIFRENILPVLRVAALASAAFAVTTFLGYQYAYKPIRANRLFKEGVRSIEKDDYRGGNRLFSQAYTLWRDKKWYFTYAEAFAKKRQYRLTRDKYEELLAEYDDYIHAKTQIRTERKKDRYFVDGSVAYAAFESKTMEDFEKARSVLKRLLDSDMYNYKGLLESGDNYTRWAESDPARFAGRYEDARKSYNVLRDAHGEKDEILFRLVEIAVRTDDRDQALWFSDYFRNRKRAKIDPYRYAELGGYLIDKGMTGDAAEILFRAMDTDRNVPEAHYHLARYFAKKEEPRDERRALDNADHLFSSSGPLNRLRLWRWVDTSGRSGELYYAQGEYIAAEKALRDGIGRYEDGLRKTLLKKDPVLGRLYEKLGDIFYYKSGDPEEALSQYRKAEGSLVRNPDLFYKKGFILYNKAEPAEALREFVKSEEDYPSNRNLLYALGNANYQRHNYSAAEGYYSFLSDRLEADRRRVEDLLPDRRSSDRALTLNRIKVYNNLGVVLFKLGERSGNKDRSSRAMVYWTMAQELSENLFRDPETLARRDVTNLPYINMRQILNPLPNFDLQIYQALPRDLRELFF